MGEPPCWIPPAGGWQPVNSIQKNIFQLDFCAEVISSLYETALIFFL